MAKGQGLDLFFDKMSMSKKTFWKCYRQVAKYRGRFFLAERFNVDGSIKTRLWKIGQRDGVSREAIRQRVLSELEAVLREHNKICVEQIEELRVEKKIERIIKEDKLLEKIYFLKNDLLSFGVKIRNNPCKYEEEYEEENKKEYRGDIDGLSVRLISCLKSAGLTNIVAFLVAEDDTFLAIRGLGKKTFKEILEMKERFSPHLTKLNKLERIVFDRQIKIEKLFLDAAILDLKNDKKMKKLT